MTKAMYAFSGDPITFGHIDIITRATKAFDEVVVGIGVNPDKDYMFSLEERTEMAKQALQDISKAKVISFEGLLVDYAYEQDIPVIVKGVRNAADIDYESTLDQIGKSQKMGIDTHILFAKPELAHVSSSNVKAIQKEHGEIHRYVPLNVKQKLEERMSNQYIIGVTGVSGSGKTYVCEKFIELGKEGNISVHNIELDHIGHDILGKLTEPRYQKVRREIADEFSKDILLPRGFIDRKKLGPKVFSSSEKMDKLNQIMHEPVLTRLRKELRGKEGLILLNAALLTEFDMTYLCNNNVLLVDVDKETQEKRLQARDNLTPKQITRRIKTQYHGTQKSNVVRQKRLQYRHGQLWTIDNFALSKPREIEDGFDLIKKDLRIE